MVQISLLLSGESSPLSGDIRELFDELAATLPQQQRAYSGECEPPLDVLETATTIEVVVDVSGVSEDALRVIFRGGVLLIVGEKAPPPAQQQRTFHLLEREFGRFARIVQLTGAFDISNSQATLRDGALTIVLTKRPDRRGAPQRIPVSTEPARES